MHLKFISARYQRFADGPMHWYISSLNITPYIFRLYQLSGEQGDVWKHITLQVVREHVPGGNDIAFAFLATRGFGYLGDIAIDDVAVYNTSCLPDGGNSSHT